MAEPTPSFGGLLSGLKGAWSGGDLPLGISDVDVRLANTIGDPSVAYIGGAALPPGSERDLASHYYVSQQLADRFGKFPAAVGGVFQEFLNRGAGGTVGSGVGGFSLDDLSANYAGIIGATPEQTARAGLFEHTEPLESWEGRGQGTISGNWDKIRALHEGSFPLVRKIKGLFTDSTPQDAGLTAGTIRSPFPPTNTTPTTQRMVRALNPNPLKVDVPRTLGGGGLFAGLGGLLSGAAPWAASLGLGLPLGMMWPSKISKEQGIVPESGPLTPQQLFKMRNDAEEQRIREGRLPVIPEVPIWNPISSAGASTTPVSPDVIFNPPKQYLQSIEQAGALGKDITPKFLGIPSRYHMREYLGATGPEPDTTGDPRVWYTEPVPEWTPPAPVIPDIVVPPPARDEPEPQVEDFSAIQEADRSRQERERKAEVKKAASAARKKEAKREAATKKKAAEQRAKLDSASKKALEDHMKWMETQSKRVEKEEKKRAKRYAGGRGGALMYT